MYSLPVVPVALINWAVIDNIPAYCVIPRGKYTLKALLKKKPSWMLIVIARFSRLQIGSLWMEPFVYLTRTHN